MTSVARMLVLAAAALAWVAPAASAQGPHAPRTPIRHVISLMQENHSFDNYFGTYPGADGISAGTCMPVDPAAPRGRCIEPFHIGNRAVEDLNHSARVHAAQYDNGRMDGFISAIARERGRVQPLVMGHYDDRDLPFYWNVADQYVLFDRMFTSAAGGSVANHMYWVTGGPGNERGDFIPHGGFDAPTIFDRLDSAGVSWKFYVQNYDPAITFRSRALGDRGSQVVWVPLLNYARYVDDPALFAHIVPMERFYEDLARDELPAVSYLVPSGSSEHPPGSIKAGETFVRTLINALMRSQVWTASAFIWTYDDWGGWFDHVKPPRVDRFGYGFRAPALLVSAYAKRGHVEHATMDFTSILRFIEENWGLPPLARRDRNATSIARAFDFSRPPRTAVFLSRDRHVTRLPQPKRRVVYVAYAGAVGLTLAVIGLAIAADLLARRRARKAPSMLAVALAAAMLPAALTAPDADAASRLRPVELSIEPAMAGIEIVQGGRTYATNRKGRVRMRVRRLPGTQRSPEGFRFATPHVRSRQLRPGVIARGGRFFLGQSPARVRVGLSLFYEVRPEFVDVRGVAVDPARIRRVVYRNSLGEVVASTRADPVELKGNWVSRSGAHAALRSKPLRYAVESVDVDGSNVVNRAQTRFFPAATQVVPIKLLFFDVTISSRDALLRVGRGSAVEVRYPDGRTLRRHFNGHSRVMLARLARGDYRVDVNADGLRTSRVLSLSRDQTIDVGVISYLDLALLAAALAGCGGALVLARRPALRRRLRGRARMLVGVLLALALCGLLAAPAGAVDAQRPVGVWAYYYIWFNVSSWNRAKLDYPALGRYSSDEPSIMRQHIRLARSAGIDGFIVSWKSTPTLDRRLRGLIAVAEQERFKLAVIYQGLDFERRPLPVRRVLFDLARFRRHFAASPVFGAFGKPLVILSGTWEFPLKDLEAVAAENGDALRLLASERNPDDYVAKAAPFEGNAYYWSSVNPDTYPRYISKLKTMARVVHERGGLWIVPAAPGFDARLIGRHIVVQRRDGATLRRELDAAQQADPDAIGLISWNEFSENTHVEPSRNFGAQALETLADAEGADFKMQGDLDSSTPSHSGGGFGPLAAALAFIVGGLVFLVVLARRRRTDVRT